MNKKITVITLAIAAALALTACSNNTNESIEQVNENSVCESSNSDNGVETVKNESITIRLGNTNQDVIYCGEWADGKPNGKGHCYYNQRNEWVGVFDGEFIDGELSGMFSTLGISRDGDYEFRIFNVVNESTEDIYVERYNTYKSPYFNYIIKQEDTEYDIDCKEYIVRDGVIVDTCYDDPLSGAEEKKVLAQIEEHFGYADAYNKLSTLIDEYIKENNIDFVIPTMPSVRDYWDNSNDNGDYGNYADSGNSNDANNSSTNEPILVRNEDIGDGQIYSGYLVNGVPNGSGELRQTLDGGTKVLKVGSFENGKLSGKGRLLKTNDESYFFCQGDFVADGLSGNGYAEYFAKGQGLVEYIGTFEGNQLVIGEKATLTSDYTGCIRIGSFYKGGNKGMCDGFRKDFDSSGTLVSCIKYTNGEEYPLSPAQISEISELQKYDAEYLYSVMASHYDHEDSYNEMKTALGF